MLKREKWSKSRDSKQQRGLAFEALVCDLFEAHGLLERRPFYTEDGRAEQIDGAISFGCLCALLEVKWVESGLAASDLFRFLGKVDGKFVGTVGVFVSHEALKENFLNALRSGRRQSVLVIHGDDMEDLFDPTFPLEDYLVAHTKYLSQANQPHYSAERFLNERKKQVEIPPEAGLDGVVADQVQQCVSSKATKNVVHEFADKLSEEQRIHGLVRLVRNHGETLSTLESPDSSWKSENLLRYAKELIKRLPKKHTEADVEFFVDTLSKDFENESFESLTTSFAPRYAYLRPEEKRQIEERLQRQWDDVFGEYFAENRMAVPTGLLWDHLTQDGKRQIVPFFVRIILSDRSSRFPQYQLARRILKQSKRRKRTRKLVTDAFHELLEGFAKTWFELTDEEEPVDDVTRSIARANSQIRDYIDDYEDTVRRVVGNVWKETVNMGSRV